MPSSLAQRGAGAFESFPVLPEAKFVYRGPGIESNYPLKDHHRIFLGEIVAALPSGELAR